MARSFVVCALAVWTMSFASTQQQTRLQEGWVVNSLRRMEQHGLFAGHIEGRRRDYTLSSYEIAGLTYVAYNNLTKRIASLQQQVDLVASNPDVDLMREDLARLNQEIKDLEALRQDIPALQRLCILYRVELEVLGADVEAMMLDLYDLDSKVTCQVFESDGATWDAAHRQTRRVVEK